MESILEMISMWRGNSLVMTLTGHFSRASGMTVWLVKARVCASGKPVRAHHTGRLESARGMCRKLLCLFMSYTHVKNVSGPRCRM